MPCKNRPWTAIFARKPCQYHEVRPDIDENAIVRRGVINRLQIHGLWPCDPKSLERSGVYWTPGDDRVSLWEGPVGQEGESEPCMNG